MDTLDNYRRIIKEVLVPYTPHSADIKADLIIIKLKRLKPEMIARESFQAFFL